MWNFVSKCMAGSFGPKNGDLMKATHIAADCSDDEVSSNSSREEGLDCPICWESFNIVENVPYVLWCGHTLCKNCILGLQWAVVKYPTLPIQLPLFISCPWCNLLSFRFVYRGNLLFPRKNFFLLWMVESMNGDREKSNSTCCKDLQPSWPSDSNSANVSCCNLRRGQYIHHPDSSANNEPSQPNSYFNVERLHSSLRKSLVFFVHLTAKFPLVIIFLLIVLYAIPASAAILALYILVTLLFALPSFLILYFAYPSLDWLVAPAKCHCVLWPYISNSGPRRGFSFSVNDCCDGYDNSKQISGCGEKQGKEQVEGSQQFGGCFFFFFFCREYGSNNGGRFYLNFTGFPSLFVLSSTDAP
ncbi:Zinc finger, RING-type, eukaryotic [Dillenia turbinata]|uniref:Zinc finger, RING-type, eukaryotic n=1 Tax=Dillenia turbinata TaxID=194707 RepID=A0AAN8VF33_9MAGN